MMTFETLQTFGRDGAGAAMKSFAALQTGAQAVLSETATYARRHMEQGSQAAERLMGARSVDTLVQIGGDYVRSSYEGFVAQSARMGEIATSAAKEASAPIEGLFAKTAQAA